MPNHPPSTAATPVPILTQSNDDVGELLVRKRRQIKLRLAQLATEELEQELASNYRTRPRHAGASVAKSVRPGRHHRVPPRERRTDNREAVLKKPQTA